MSTAAVPLAPSVRGAVGVAGNEELAVLGALRIRPEGEVSSAETREELGLPLVGNRIAFQDGLLSSTRIVLLGRRAMASSSRWDLGGPMASGSRFAAADDEEDEWQDVGHSLSR